MKNKLLVSSLLLVSLATGVTLVTDEKQQEVNNEFVSVEDLEKDSTANNQSINSYDVVEMKSTYSIDTADLTEVVKDADLIFVATVDSINETDYRHPVEVRDEQENLEEVIYSPYTNYSVTVLSSISGEFDPSQKLSIYKTGGIEQNQQFVEVLEGDELPEVGNSYVFTAYIQDDGSLLVSGINSNRELDQEVIKNLNLENNNEISNEEIQDELLQDESVNSYSQAYEESPLSSEEVNENIENMQEDVFISSN